MPMLQIINLLLFLAVVGYAIYLVSYILYSRYMFVKLGKPADLKKDLGQRVNQTMVNVFGQKKLLKDTKSGIMHVVMFYGFIVIQFGAIDLFYKGLFPGKHLPLPAYGVFTFIQEFVVFSVLLATIYAFYRRYVEQLARLKRGFKAGLVIIFLTSLLTSILFAAAFEQIWLGIEPSWEMPISSLLAFPFAGWMSATAAAVLFYIFWWIHLITVLAFAVYVPQSKHFHLIAGPINVFLKRTDPPSKLRTIDFEDESLTEYGVSKIEDFHENQLIDLYACVECGRCTNMCPASNTGKMLSPMDLLVKMRDHLTDKGAAITSRTPWMPAFAFSGANEAALNVGVTKEEDGTYKYPIDLIGDVITEEELWACTTCRNCEDACPVSNEHVDKIMDMRRHLVLTQGKMSPEVARTFQNIERQGNPWGLSRKDRAKWTESADTDVPSVKEKKEFEYLLYVGSMGSYDNRSQKITHSLVKLLNQAGIDFAILGKKEKNSGDTARRLGNEFLYQQFAMDNIALFEKHNVKKIVTADPHAYNVFKNEYPDMGLEDIEVMHHTQLLAQLIRDGRLTPTKEVNERVTFHDSCYLGRYNDEYEAPRDIFRAIPGIELVEMDRNRENGMCCGAGGGLMWMEEDKGVRVNVARTEQALKVTPSMIGSACPYCLTMLSDGTKSKEMEEQVKTMDVAEVLAMSIEFDEHIEVADGVH
ncbi:heterodisulfide reductase-related iron-sulfur binding cluster [Mechercharimyces sp. CAU 1602]|uniref:heterodisulfide reductase-related iron-sulfur binding cluster n=1 Tax=Mechercharimyces sp. CAU 1602 TaxID=2973933 RepID=UPI002163513F|nr:heterodisulfide reductase-related iron-sulfur binding cluster [Mechercharimyces sp. CAU 1602]MCS1352628.1 heterodisulfide reductase-related iron-sulfur binding cluster [Mechercharimyces sp. CAU 1602]